MDAKTCVHCEGPTAGYKCDVCNEESDTHNPSHAHGADHMVAKCAQCNEAESKCTC